MAFDYKTMQQVKAAAARLIKQAAPCLKNTWFGQRRIYWYATVVA